LVGLVREAASLLDKTLVRTTGAVAAALVLVLAVGHAGMAAADVGPDPSDVGGTLTTGQALSGTAEIDFLVNPGATYTATITVDGDQLVSDSVVQGSAHLYLDTTTLPDGSHGVVVTVAGGGVSDTVWRGTIETLNAPRGGVPTIAGSSEVGSTLTASPGSWLPLPSTIAYQWERCLGAGSCAPIAGATGASYELSQTDANAQVEVEVTAADTSGSTTAASAPSPTVVLAGSLVASGAANGSNACNTAQLGAEIGSGATARVSLGQRATVHGELDCGGTPVAGAALDLALAPARGSTPTAHAQVETSADGSFSYTVPPGPSRDITLTYSAYSGAAAPSAVATLALLVRPRLTLRITPRRTTNGHTIRFSGRVLGGYIAHAGLPLEIEYREGRQWMIYTEVVASAATGRFSWRYTFERTTESITYSFRVAIPTTGVADYPYQPAVSPVSSVHVDP
jgi:hypothetical protein